MYTEQYQHNSHLRESKN